MIDILTNICNANSNMPLFLGMAAKLTVYIPGRRTCNSILQVTQSMFRYSINYYALLSQTIYSRYHIWQPEVSDETGALLAHFIVYSL